MTEWDWPDSTITRIVDGDTITALLTRDLGFHGTATFTQRLRLNRINTPPARTEAGKAATVQLGLLVNQRTVHITTTGAYKYGDEWQAEVVLPDGRNVSDTLVGLGLAVYWDGNGPRPGG